MLFAYSLDLATRNTGWLFTACTHNNASNSNSTCNSAVVFSKA